MEYFLLKVRLHPNLDVIFPSYKEILDTTELGKWHNFLGLKTKDPWSKCKPSMVHLADWGTSEYRLGCV